MVKEELHNRFNLISEERVKISKHNSHGQYGSDWTSLSIYVRRPHHQWGPVV